MFYAVLYSSFFDVNKISYVILLHKFAPLIALTYRVDTKGRLMAFLYLSNS